MLIPGRKVPSFDHAEKPGDFWITGERLVFLCPCGCASVAGIKIHKGPAQAGYWSWNGDTEKPTVEPSIQIIGGCNWHGYLRNGDFITC